MPTVELPPRKRGEANVKISGARSIVIVGANGSGKTRLGSFVEKSAGASAHRISAQRSLVIPKFVQPRAYEQATSTFLYGHYEPTWKAEQGLAHKAGHRWGNDPFSHTLNDFEHVLALLFADEAKRNRDYARKALDELPKARPLGCKLDDLQAIWAAVMPQRVLEIGDDRISAKTAAGASYEARYMSDGERVAVYLMGQALCAPIDGVVIIDEPEIHLHRAIQPVLWDEIERARTDCTFVYITHDLEFAATRIASRRIWLKEFDGTDWIWEDLGAGTSLPDALTMQVFGSRRPILFVEGDETSYDLAIYSALYPKEHVVPRGSASKVRESTKALANLPALHHLAVRGIVDRDRRGDEEIGALKAAGLLVADVAEVENLLCLPEALHGAATQLKLKDVGADVAAAQSRVLEELGKQRDQQALSRALAELQFRLNGFGPKIGKSDAVTLEQDLKAYLASIDVPTAVKANRKIFDDVVARADYLAALRFFNCKGMVSFVATAFGVDKDVYVGIVLALLKDDPTGVIGTAMRKAIEG